MGKVQPSSNMIAANILPPKYFEAAAQNARECAEFIENLCTGIARFGETLTTMYNAHGHILRNRLVLARQRNVQLDGTYRLFRIHSRL